jgi:diguanylate cyclase (GGDEF)-like protein
MRLTTKYSVWGVVAGVVAPLGLFAYAVGAEYQFNPLELFGVMAMGGVITFAFAGRMIGRRDEALVESNRSLSLLSDQLRALSTTDGLTQVPNRRTFDDELAIELARSTRYRLPLALVMVDLDHFKALNDRHGHPAGDEVLRKTAAILDAEKRAGDLVARYGGEEFVAILPHADAEAARAWAERARARIAYLRVPWGTDTLAITASFGIAALPGHGATAAALIEAADHALYQAKQQGRNRTTVAGPIGGAESTLPAA